MKPKLIALIIIFCLPALVTVYYYIKSFEPLVIDFESCAKAGNSVMESYPRMCRHKGITYTEVIEPVTFLTETEAKTIAEKNCIKGGESIEPGYYNESSKTWWFDANLNTVKEGCSPACVVWDETKETEINWRCTGLQR